MKKRNPVVFLGLEDEDVRGALADLIDQHGNIQMYQQKKGYRYTITFRFRKEDLHLREQLHNHLGGYKSEQEVGDHLIYYWLSVHQYRAYMVLKTLLPMLHEKRELADILIEFYEFVKSNRCRKLTPEVKNKRESLLQFFQREQRRLYNKAIHG
jgi:hypothetical protein